MAMLRIRFPLTAWLLAAVLWACTTGLGSAALQAQLINIETPLHVSGERSFERFGVNFGFGFPAGRGPGSRVVGLGPQGQWLPYIGFQQHAGGIPPFGGYSPAAGAQFGFRRIGPNGGGFGLGFQFAQGSQRTNVTTAPSLTVMNGGSGYLFSGAQRPFVTGVVPVLGNQMVAPSPVIDNAVTRAIASGGLTLGAAPAEESGEPLQATFSSTDSSAMQASASVQQIKQQRQAMLEARQAQVLQRLRAGDAALESGDPVQARIEYRSALAVDDSPEIRQMVKERIEQTRQSDAKSSAGSSRR